MTATRAEGAAAESRPSQMVASEIRAAMGRKGINQAELSRRLHVAQPWLSRRISPTSNVDLTVEELVSMAKALDVSVQGLLLPLLPRLDSNQQPSGYPSPQVRGPLSAPSAPVVPIGAARGGARVNGLPRSRPVPSGAPRALRSVV